MTAPALLPPLPLAGALGIGAGTCLVVDSLAFDLFGREGALPGTLGVLVPLLGVFLLTGLYAAVRPGGSLLDWGYALNTVGLMLVAGVDFTRTYALSGLDEDVVDGLLASGPLKPAFIAAGSVFIVGAVLFGAALIRADFAKAPAWLYVLTAAPSGFAGQLPAAVGAGAQVANGAAIVALGLALLGRPLGRTPAASLR